MDCGESVLNENASIGQNRGRESLIDKSAVSLSVEDLRPRWAITTTRLIPSGVIGEAPSDASASDCG